MPGIEDKNWDIVSQYLNAYIWKCVILYLYMSVPLNYLRNSV